MFSFLYNRTINKKNIARDNSFNVTYSQINNNIFKKSIIIYENNDAFIYKTPIQSLDLENPTHFKIYQILNDIDTIYYQDISKNNIIDIDSDNTFITNKKNIQDEIKKENIKKFIECFDFDIDKHKIN